MDSGDVRDCAGEIAARAATWTQSAVFARELGARTALYSAHGTRTFAELDENANRLARALRGAGLRRSDGLLLMCRNRPEFCETYLAAMRIGLRLIPVNTHLNAAEVGYIAADSRARALVTEEALEAGVAAAAVLKDRAALVAIDGAPAGFADYRSVLAESSPAELESPEPGTQMLYTSGTTGHPKGVFRPEPEITLPQYAGTHANYDPATDVNLCAGPAYHAAPLLMDIRWPLASGVPIVLLERWDTLRVLELIERHRVTHTHLVPTMFQRLLTLPQEVRRAHDVSSLRFVVHGAAPCPVAVKRAMIEWLGPVIYEYYAGTEGGEGINITSEEWLRKPGSVGRFDAAFGHRILDERGNAVPRGQVGRVYFEAPRVNRFEYFNDPAKTARAYAGGLFTLGDLGYVDEDGYLFLTGRTAESIISGGVNIFPQEVDNELHTHPAVQDVCTVGVPSEEWGEEVCTVVVLRDGCVASDELAAELIAYTRARLAHYKCPRTIRFAAELPRLASGKVQRDVVRAQFWSGRSRSI